MTGARWAWLAVIVCGCRYQLSVCAEQLLAGGPSAGNDWKDAPNILRQAAAHPAIASTLGWWSGCWIQPTLLYYRPLTSVAFWLEYQAFGKSGLGGFMAVHILSHCIVLILLWHFVRHLAGEAAAWPVTAIFAWGATAAFGLPDPAPALSHWVNDNDLWMTACVIGSVWSWLLWRLKNRWWHFAISLLCLSGAILFKEAGFMAAGIIVALWATERDWRASPHAATAVAVAAGWFVWRWHCLGGLGMRYGSNGAWPLRTLPNLFGVPPYLLAGDLLPLSIALSLIVTIYLLVIVCEIFHKFPHSGIVERNLDDWTSFGGRCDRCNAFVGIALCGIAGAIIAAALDPALYHESLGDEALHLIGSSIVWSEAVWLSAWMAVVWLAVVSKCKAVWLGYAWAVIAYLPAVMTPIGTHCYYLPAVGWSIALGCIAQSRIAGLVSPVLIAYLDSVFSHRIYRVIAIPIPKIGVGYME